MHPTLAALLLSVACAQAASALVIADSVDDFSGVQGQGGWLYGFVEGPLPVGPFQELGFFGAVQPGVWSLEATAPPDTLIAADSMHSTAAPGEQWAVRRWVSDVDADVVISGRLESLESDPTADGTTGRIQVNNNQRFLDTVVNLSYTNDAGVLTGPSTVTIGIDDVSGPDNAAYAVPYLWDVVATEYGLHLGSRGNKPLSGVEAQAIAARTYSF